MYFKFFNKKKRRIHLDFASTTPVRPHIVERMRPYWNDVWANPSAIYKEGVAAHQIVEDMRTTLARTLRIRPNEVTFTSGGTESNNLALIGLVEALHAGGRAYTEMEIISTRIEHPSVLETLVYLEQRGVRVVYVPVTEEGLIDLAQLESVLTPQTVLVTVAYVNSEVGVVQDVKKITRIVRAYNDAHTVHIGTHIDASQAPLWLSCALDQLGVDMMTLDSGKCYGPKGMGVLAHRHTVKLLPIVFGGGQESGLRSGTENAALIVGGVHALVEAQTKYKERSETVAKLRDMFFDLLDQHIEQVVINGSRNARVANNVNISIPGMDTEYAAIWLDAQGIAVSTKSACGAHETTGSRVVREMTHDDDRARSTLRFTLGEESVVAECHEAVRVLREFQIRMTQVV